MMLWGQVFTIIATVGAWVFAFWRITDKRMDLMEKHHREDISKMDAQAQRMDALHREDAQKHKEDMQRMDEKWERLFDKFIEYNRR